MLLDISELTPEEQKRLRRLLNEELVAILEDGLDAAEQEIKNRILH
jgi:hypothetical protein